jgi:hypothetical protein
LPKRPGSKQFDEDFSDGLSAAAAALIGVIMTAKRPQLAVTGSTGALGGRVAQLLAEQSLPQRRLVRTPALAISHGPGEGSTAFRRIKRLNKLIPTFDCGSRERNRDIIAQEDRVFRSLMPTRPGEYMVMDTEAHRTHRR